MRKNRRSRFEWRKPRFHRSDPKIIRGKEAREIKSSTTGRLSQTDLYTKWKSPISRETFDGLVEKGVLSDKQIANYLLMEEQRGKTRQNNSIKSKASKHKDYSLIVEISKIDLKTAEGSKVFKELVRKRPEALQLIGEAQKLKAAAK